ncbi:MAG: 2,5-diamino-6-(ribosylamino)-4(3H)-pyrimidinone 5'-phosphate reductase [Thaumarchaeota archaeon S15]|nr:MAG: 2,5-diamino-6-(ribosylamino)-4(3H)-pyrimidinone 5'-phosphate reductase [Thaumarchaeota archaeon S15]
MAASRPRVTLSAAVSIDGKIATRTGDSGLSSRRDLARVHRLRASHDAILVGIGTVLADDPLLTVRLARGRSPVRVILDSRARLPPSSRIARTCGEVRTIVAVSRAAPARRLARLRGMGVEAIAAGRERASPRAALSRLSRLGIRSVLLEGGSRANWSLVRAGLVDEAVICVVPRLLGGAAAPGLLGGAGYARVASARRARLASARAQGGELVVRYRL